MVQVQSIQPTPNPNAFKFVVDGVLYAGTKSYATAAEAAGHDLAESLFAIDGVDTLFFCDRFVTVSMKASADWRFVHEQATRALESYQPDGEAAAPGAAEATEDGGGFDASQLGDSERALLERIDEIWDDPKVIRGALNAEILSESSRNPRINEILKGRYKRIHNRLIEVIRAGQQRGHIDPELDASGFATLLYSVVDGLTVAEAASLIPNKQQATDAVRLMLQRCLRPGEA